MKHSRCTKIMSIVMALTVVMASFSFSIEQHFCGSNLVDVSVFSKTESCCCPPLKEGSLQLKKKSCCSNISILFEGFDNYQNAISTEILTAPIFVETPAIQIPVAYVFETTRKVPYTNYNPVPLITDIQVRDQVFLIWFRLFFTSNSFGSSLCISIHL